MVSIITPHFNRLNFIEATAESVLKQTSNDWQWIIVDDGSDDESLKKIEAIESRDERITLIQREREPKGACTCRNIGVQNAIGDYVLFLDSDDLLAPHCIEERVRWVEMAPKHSIYFWDTIVFEREPTHGLYWDDIIHPETWLACLFSMTPPCQTSGPLWTKEAIKKINGWNETLHVWQDIDFHLRAIASGIHLVKVADQRPDIYIRVSPDSISRVDFHSPRKLSSRFAVIEMVKKEFNPIKFSNKESGAFQRMVLSVFLNALNLKDWSLTKKIIVTFQTSRLLTPDQLKWLSILQRARMWKLHRIPMLQQLMDIQTTRFFPMPFNRKLGTVKQNQ